MAHTAPTGLTIRTYQVGFGDCFLLSFGYADGSERHVLIDFGSTGMPNGVPHAKQMLAIAEDIRARTNGKLHAVVATHRHKDHIAGFARGKSGKGPGRIIRDLDPDIVLQPWTEHPDLETDALDLGSRPATTGLRAANAAHAASLAAMQAFARDIGRELRGIGAELHPAVARQLSFIGDDNISNRDAVENLMTMGRKRRYLHFGARPGLDSILPGVTVRVLGPPTLKQSDSIRRQRAEHADEFWHLQARTRGLSEPTRRSRTLFPRAARHRRGHEPLETRWLINHSRNLRGDQLLGIVRALDNAINNTSLILLFEVGGRRLLFPGDAQIENWSYALSRKSVRERLKGTQVYKVGHHGSLNATPKSLFDLFDKRRSRRPGRSPLLSIMSTLAGKHGDEHNDTEVPREKLVTALSQETDLRTTQTLKSELFFEISIAL